MNLKNPRLLYVLACVGILISIVIDFRDGNMWKVAGTSCLFLAFLVQAIYYPDTKGWKSWAVIFFTTVAIGLWLYRWLVLGL